MANIVLGITKQRGTDEYKVVWNSNGRLLERMSYYTDSDLDAVNTLTDMASRAYKSGNKVSLSTSKLTQNLVTKYMPELRKSLTKRRTRISRKSKSVCPECGRPSESFKTHLYHLVPYCRTCNRPY